MSDLRASRRTPCPPSARTTPCLSRSIGSCTWFVSNYVFDDAHKENREDEDAQAILTFIAVDSLDAPERVLAALLPSALRYTAEPKLTNATICLAFDVQGGLQMMR